MTTPKYEFENFIDGGGITIEDGEFVYQEQPHYWAEYKIDGVSTTLYAHFDCADYWRWSDDEGTEEGLSLIKENYFNSDDEGFCEFTNAILEESEPKQGITIEQKANCLRNSYDDIESLMVLADNVKSICPEKSVDFALVLSFYSKGGVIDPLSFELNLQINNDLTKEQSLAITNLFCE